MSSTKSLPLRIACDGESASGKSFASKLSSNAMNNFVIFISFGVMVYILVQMIIVLNKPEFLYYTLWPMPTDLSNTQLI